MKRYNIERLIGGILAAGAGPFIAYGQPWGEVAAAIAGIGTFLAGLGQGRKIGEDK